MLPLVFPVFVFVVGGGVVFSGGGVVLSEGGVPSEGGASLLESAGVLPESLKLKSILGGSSAAKAVSAEAPKILTVKAVRASEYRETLIVFFIFGFLLY